MTLKEAKKILKKEGFILSLASKVINQTGAMREFEKPEVCEAIKVANANRWTVSLSTIEWYKREKRLKKEYEQNTKASGHGEEQSEEKKGIIYPSTSPKADFYYKHVLNEGNPALKEAASQFNDALLDEQAKKIKRLGKEISKLNSIIHDKNAVLSDVAEELRLSKIREKNLTEVCQKYMKENEKLKKELADKVVDKIDAQALKSAESALAWKEKVIAEEDEVIAYLGKELEATKKELEEANYRIKAIRNGSKQYCEYGIAAEKMIQKMAKVIVKEGAVSSEDFKEYRRLANGYRFNPQLPELSEEEEKKLSPFNDDNSHGEVTNQKDISPSLKVTVRLFGEDVRDLFKNMQHLWQ